MLFTNWMIVLIKYARWLPFFVYVNTEDERELGFWIQTAWVRIRLYFVQVVYSRAKDFKSLCLSFLSYKVGTADPKLYSCMKIKLVNMHKALTTVPATQSVLRKSWVLSLLLSWLLLFLLFTWRGWGIHIYKRNPKVHKTGISFVKASLLFFSIIHMLIMFTQTSGFNCRL